MRIATTPLRASAIDRYTGLTCHLLVLAIRERHGGSHISRSDTFRGDVGSIRRLPSRHSRRRPRACGCGIGARPPRGWRRCAPCLGGSGPGTRSRNTSSKRCFGPGHRYGLALLLAPVGFEVRDKSHRRRRRWCCLHESHSARSINDRRWGASRRLQAHHARLIQVRNRTSIC